MFRRITGILAAAAAALLIVPAAPADATTAGFAGVPREFGFVDFNGDHSGDYCEAQNSRYLHCDLLTGTGLLFATGGSIADLGWSAGRAWTDFNGDGRADYCRVIGSGYTDLQCTVSTGGGFGATYTSGAVDAGWDAGRTWADFDGDGRADYCRVVGGSDKRISCTLSTGTNWSDTYTSGPLDPGYDAGRAWVDVNGDRRADYCRVVGSGYKYLQCTLALSTGIGFGLTVTSGVVDPGYDDTRKWADVNGDGRADYCRFVGSANYAAMNIQCTPATGSGFGSTGMSPVMDGGYAGRSAWADVNGDGRADFCRVVNYGGYQDLCTLSDGSGWSTTSFAHPMPSDGGWPYYPDVNGDGKADHCTVIDKITCWLSDGASFNGTFTAPR
ncbi:VCBS repeat-containing protein [Dactylosporangium vinaceum]|uniref:FG-GAP repeat domain-containing protein n=1 Tax=Dactylosporangium vinaceum TaxID=53362 RepID=A0ABV5MJL8_9ACTN|nr:VCBS repeat-containing protein [Dactylosporangium vinaceum]UAB92832.1 VCBS repeat-containing protein [Dactylosporangium vinaceum]